MKIYNTETILNDWTRIADLDANKKYRLIFTPSETSIIEVHIHDLLDDKKVSRVNAPGSKFIGGKASSVKFLTGNNGNYLCVKANHGTLNNITVEEI